MTVGDARTRQLRESPVHLPHYIGPSLRRSLRSRAQQQNPRRIRARHFSSLAEQAVAGDSAWLSAIVLLQPRPAMEGQEEAQPIFADALPPWLTTEWPKLQHELPQLITTVLVFFFTLVLLSTAAQFAFRRKKSKTVLLVGLNGAGKTALFFQLKDGTTHQGAVTSMEPNEGTFVFHSETTKKGKIKPVHIVDVPGHPKLRPHLEELLPKACCLVFLVDALDFMPHKEAAAEYLYDILTNKEVVRRKIPLLLTCNKMDKVTAHSSNFIRGQLEKELNKLRKSRIAISAADVSSEIHLGLEGDSLFNFTQCSNKVTIAEVSALTGDVEQVEQFIREHVKQ